LTRLNISDSFLALPPQKWIENEDYKRGREIERVQQLRVVNDTAERGVKLFEEFNQLIKMMKKKSNFFSKWLKRIGRLFPLRLPRNLLLVPLLL